MAKVEIYTTSICPFCIRAKSLLDKKNVTYSETDVMADTAKRTEMLKRSEGRKTVPQIFIDNEAIGGCDELYALNKSGALDALLGA